MLVSRKTIVLSILAAAQCSAVAGSLLVAIVLTFLRGGMAFWKSLLVFPAVAIMAFFGVNLVTTFIALPLRLLFRRRVSGLTTVLISTAAGAIIYLLSDLVLTGLWLLQQEGEVTASGLGWRTVAFFTITGGSYGFLFGFAYHKFEARSMEQQHGYDSTG